MLRPPPCRRLAARKFRRGAAAVEFALTASVFFVLLFASVECVRAFNVLHTIHNAAYEGARFGIVPGATNTRVVQRADSIIRSIGVNGAQIVVAPSNITPQTTTVAVTVRVPMNSNGWVTPLLFRNKVLETTMTMRREEFSQNSTP